MLLLALLAACAGSPKDRPPASDTSSETTPTGGTTPAASTPTGASPTPTTPPTDTWQALADAGFTVGEGALVFSSMEGCCDPDANCWGNNPSTPYGTYALPPAPGRPARDDALLDDFGPIPEGLSRDFLLRRDEAIVWLGTLPPSARYLGLRTYLGRRPGIPYAIVGSLGASLNNQVLAEQRGHADIWGEPVAVVTSADADVERDVVAALESVGWAPEHIAVDRLPPDVVNLGLEPGRHDSLFGLVRVAVYDDNVAGAAWQADPGRLWRLTPDPERESAAPHPIPELPARGTGTTEDAWVDAALELADAVNARHGPDGLLSLAVPYWAETLDCITSGLTCTGDIRDRYSAITPSFLLPTPGSYVVAFGANHERTGKATYSSVSVQTIVSQRGIASFTSADMPGSARAYLDHPLVDDLYVVIFARTCDGFDAPCVEVPWDCPGGPADEQLKLTARAYLEPATGAAPLPEEMVNDLAYLVVPDAPTTGDTGP